jgi:phospholipase/carboxylesterase
VAETGFEYLAFGPEKGQPTKLIVLLHGYGRNAHYMKKMADAARAAVPGALVICPHGPEPLDTAAMGHDPDDKKHLLHIPQDAKDSNGGNDPSLRRQWFRIDGRAADLMPRIQVAAGHLNKFIDHQRDILGIKDRDIVLMGFSQGGGLALYTAFTRAHDLGGMVCHSSIVVQKKPDPKMVSRPETFYIYGTMDPEFSQTRFCDTFNWLQGYTGGKVTEKTVKDMGHYTNAESRRHCADFMKKVLA